METETGAAKALHFTSEEMYDAACKRLFAEKEILAWIMQLAMEEYDGMTPKEIVPYIEGTPEVSSVAVMPDETNAGRIRGSNTEDSTFTEGTVYYDIRFDATAPKTDEKIKLIVNVEAQSSSSPGYPLTKRALYYCARMLSAQNGVEFEKSHYENIKKVYSIWIVSRPPKYAENTVTEYEIRENCKIGGTTVKRDDYDVLKVVFLYLGDPVEGQENNALRLLDIIRSDEMTQRQKMDALEGDFQIPMTENVSTEVTEMCNWSKGVKEAAMEKGLQQGLEKGRAEGRAEGKLAQMLKVFLTLLSRGMKFEEAANIAGAETPKEIEYLREHMPA